ncbi:MAG: glycosyltransferase family A protein [Pedobacter sp.]|uniref:glycosyltransferase family 2 protein n=1 Tax=Pedobacter sp. TaxID=1411316 RepID=UPI0035676B71
MISVVIPMYNAEATILQSLNSIKHQTFNDLEIIIVNDGSTDKGQEIVEKFIAHNVHLSVLLINKKNEGVSKARNVGIKSASGEYIAFLDSDDEWHKDKLKIQFEILVNNPDVILLGCNRNGEHVSRFLKKKFSRLTIITSRILLYRNFFSTPSVIFRKEVINKVGLFDENQKHTEDCNYWVRICQAGTCVLLNESYVTTGGGKPSFGFSGLSSNLVEMEKGDLKNIKDGYKLGVIGIFEYFLLIGYSLLKFIRRLIIVKFR